MNHLLFRPTAPVVALLELLDPTARGEWVSAALITELPRLLAEGFPPGGPPSGGQPVRVKLDGARHFQLIEASQRLGVPPATILKEVTAARAAEVERDTLEAEWRRRGCPGDPRHLSLTVLRIWLRDNPTPSREWVCVVELTKVVQELLHRVDELSKRIETHVARPIEANLSQMGAAELRAHLVRLGGKPPRHATRTELLSRVRKKIKGIS